MAMTLVLIAILALLLMRIPVAFAIMVPCTVYFILSGYSNELALKSVLNQVNSFPLMAVPLFIFVGVTANKAGIADRLFAFAQAALAKVRGNLAYVNIATSVGFSWMSGSALADAAGLGKMQVPAMVRAGYPFGFSAGLTASAALVAPVMPPSIPAVIFASVATVSTGALFAAGVVPAFLIALGLAIFAFFAVRRMPNLAGGEFSWSLLRTTTVRVIASFGAPILILGGIMGGFFTPTEAAAVAGLYMIGLGVMYRELTWRKLWDAARETLYISGGIMLIIGAAGMLGQVMTRERVAVQLAEWMTSITDSPIVFLVLVNLILIVLGMFIDATAVILAAVPILLPVAVTFGIDPIHFGVITIVNLMIGLLTPPVGSVLFVMSTVTRVSINQLFRAVLPFLLPLVCVQVLLTVFPELSLALPRLLGF